MNPRERDHEKVTGKCDQCKEWKEKTVYFDRKTGKVNCITFSKEEGTKPHRYVPVEIEVEIDRIRGCFLEDIIKIVDKLRSEFPYAETHFKIKY